MRRLLAALVVCGLPCNALTAALDVPTPYIPSTRLNVDEMLRLADVGPQDVVFDLGSGDGRVVIAAARDYGARGVGIEIDAGLVAESKDNARRDRVADRVQFRHGDLFGSDLSDASVVTMYLLSSLTEKLQPKLFNELKPGTRVVAHDYGFPDWKPDRRVTISKTYYLYIVPARVGGKWRLRFGARDYEFELEQRFQEIRGGARVAGGFLPAFEAQLAGDRIGFVLVEDDLAYRFEGRVRGDAMDGVVRSGYGPRQTAGPWHAARVTPAAGL
jgi:SAM-dependent methyltransferase